MNYENDSGVPKISTWRENLVCARDCFKITTQTHRPQTGLSHVHNLYFIAIVDEIWLYQPSFPLQKLGTEPLLKIRPPKSGQNLPGYLDTRQPHSINHLLVTFLGIEEIVLVTCDDGDVIGFRVDEIQRAIERRLEPDCAEDVFATDVRHFFLKNVGKSAWGIAVHTEARKIAISANTYKVTVFEFALASEGNNKQDDCGDAGGGEAESDSSTKGETVLQSRKQDRAYTLHGQRDNIPCVTFCNTPDDPEGRYLACGAINGMIHVWDLHRREVLELDQIDYCTSFRPSSQCSCLTRFENRYPHSGQ